MSNTWKKGILFRIIIDMEYNIEKYIIKSSDAKEYCLTEEEFNKFYFGKALNYCQGQIDQFYYILDSIGIPVFFQTKKKILSKKREASDIRV